jgi:hypothetical protein
MIWSSLHNYNFRKIDKIDTTVSTFVYLLLAALHVSTPFLGHPQAYTNIDISYYINKYEFICCLKWLFYTTKKLDIKYVSDIAEICYKIDIKHIQIKHIINQN